MIGYIHFNRSSERLGRLFSLFYTYTFKLFALQNQINTFLFLHFFQEDTFIGFRVGVTPTDH